MRNDINSILQKLINNAKQGKRKIDSFYPIYGFWETIRQVWKNVIQFEKYFRLDKELGKTVKPVMPKIPIRIEIIRRGFDLEKWTGKKELLEIRGEYGLEQFQKRIERGDLCFAGYSNRAFVGFVWIEFPPVTEAGYQLYTNEAYTYDGWTFEEYRGNRVLAVIHQAIMNWVRQNRRDLHKLVTHVAIWNKPSLAMDQRAGYVIVRQELSFVILGYHKKFVINRAIPTELIKAPK